MDVKFPNRAAAAPAGRPVAPASEPAPEVPTSSSTQPNTMTVHEPPKAQGEAATAAPTKAEQPKPEPKQAIEKPRQAPGAHLKPGATQGGTKPTGVIVATVFVMLILIGVTIMAYISSNS